MKLLSVIICLAVFSCSPVRHWKGVATDTKVTPEKKAIIAPKVAEMFPASVEYLPGEVVTVTDTVVDIEQALVFADIIDSLLFITVKDSTNRDSITTAILKRFKPTRTVVRERTVDTVYKPGPGSSAELYSANQNLKVCEQTNAKLQTELDQVTKKVKEQKAWWQDRWFWVAVAFAIAFILSTILHFKR